MIRWKKIVKLLICSISEEEQALIELSEKYGTACKRIAGNILKNHRDAEECVNDTYLAVWNTIPPKNPNPLRLIYSGLSEIYLLRSTMRTLVLSGTAIMMWRCRNWRTVLWQ